MRWKKNTKVFWIFSIIYLLSGCQPTVDNVIYVNENINVVVDGKSWESSFSNFQDALDVAITGQEIWVAEGIYKPSKKNGGASERHQSFQLKKGVGIYGGFLGNESNRDERDWLSNKTILSGDLGDNDNGFQNNDENCYHVVTGNESDSTAILDGFIIIGGNANFDTWPDDGGGGMNNHNGSPTITNCNFKGNFAYADGGGMRNWGDSNPLIYNCIFIENSATQEGGGMMNGPDSKPTVVNCSFINNYAGEDGGGMYNNESYNSLIINCIFYSNSAELTGGGVYNVNTSSPNIINCSFSNNSAENAGGAICNNNGFPNLVNCILWDNTAPSNTEINNFEPSVSNVSFCNISGGYKGEGNLNSDPKFVGENLRLSADSPCIDAGDNNALPEWLIEDSYGNARIVNKIVDIGAAEFNR